MRLNVVGIQHLELNVVGIQHQMKVNLVAVVERKKTNLLVLCFQKAFAGQIIQQIQTFLQNFGFVQISSVLLLLMSHSPKLCPLQCKQWNLVLFQWRDLSNPCKFSERFFCVCVCVSFSRSSQVQWKAFKGLQLFNKHLHSSRHASRKIRFVCKMFFICTYNWISCSSLSIQARALRFTSKGCHCALRTICTPLR